MAYETLAYIIDGAFAGSESVQVMSVRANGTTVLVYDNIINEDGGFNELGTGTLSGNVATVALSRPLIKSEAISAYVADFGQNNGGSVVVGDNGTIPTGWKIPTEVSVDGDAPITAAEYETATGLTLANVYDPETRNVTPLFPNSGIERLLEIGFDLNSAAGLTSVVLSVQNIRNCSAGYTITFDGGAPGMTSSKTYLANTTATVRVTDANDATRYHERTFAIVVPTPPPPSSEISNASYIDTKAGNLSGITVVADSAVPLEMMVDGVFPFTWSAMVFKGANRWEKNLAVTNGPGTYTARVRVISDTGELIMFSGNL